MKVIRWTLPFCSFFIYACMWSGISNEAAICLFILCCSCTFYVREKGIADLILILLWLVAGQKQILHYWQIMCWHCWRTISLRRNCKNYVLINCTISLEMVHSNIKFFVPLISNIFWHFYLVFSLHCCDVCN